MWNECRFCEVLTTDNQFALNLPENTILLETENFIVIPTLGQFIEGWLMIVSKEHKRAASTMNYIELTELNDLIKTVRQIIEYAYGKTIIFEHGPAKSPYKKAGCCVEHMHIHVVPFKNKLSSVIDFIPFPHIKIFSFKALSLLSVDESYLLLGEKSFSDEFYLFQVNKTIPNQYLRQIIAVISDKDNQWDWRQHFMRDNIERSIHKLYPYFKAIAREKYVTC